MSRAQISSIEDRFVEAVKSALESEPDWSGVSVILPRRTVGGDVETAEFADSSYLTGAAYNFSANALRITLRNGEILRIAPMPVEYWDRLLAAPSKGKFFLQYITPRFNVERLNPGWFRRMCVRFKSRLQVI